MQKRKCTVCKTQYPLTDKHFHKDKSRPSGFMFNCKKCEKKRAHTKYLKNPRKLRYSLLSDEQKARRLVIANKYRKTPKGKAIFYLKAYQKFDKERGYVCDIDQAYLLESFKRLCTYCGFPSTGVDRINNKEGHTIINCVPCCSECNTARMDNFTYEEMKILGKAIAKIKQLRVLNL